MGKVVAIASGKGGTGKSTVTAFLARALSERGKSTLVVEADFGLRSLDLILGANQTLYDCADVLHRNCRLSEAVVSVGPMGLWLLPGGSDPDDMPDPQQWQALLELCRRCYDFVLVDLPGGLGKLVRQTCAAADITLAVVTPDSVSVRDCAQLSRLLLQAGAENQKLIINRVPQKLTGSLQDLDQVIDGTGVMLQGVVPLSQEVVQASARGIPLPEGRAKTAFANIAARLCGQHRPLCIR